MADFQVVFYVSSKDRDSDEIQLYLEGLLAQRRDLRVISEINVYEV